MAVKHRQKRGGCIIASLESYGKSGLWSKVEDQEEELCIDVDVEVECH